MILDYFIFNDTHTSLFYCHLCQWDTLCICCYCCFKKDLIYLFLCKCSKYFLCFSHCFHFCYKSFYVINNSWYVRFLLWHINILRKCCISLLRGLVYYLVKYLSIYCLLFSHLRLFTQWIFHFFYFIMQFIQYRNKFFLVFDLQILVFQPFLTL